ncbi:Glucuronoxylan 4-o-methyltransferase 1-like protein [Melia azedarach]|uniref:Glucuronoxylan 4-o-methyltransferase 1-like protein n=1 Tax=Melia azedarach TaxID=155640 RepID=A0ACC1Z2F2_MELAZ|nr:Glucuronoxylan 4-o-methyltransferase 1-like protein [Melia azedarach]
MRNPSRPFVMERPLFLGAFLTIAMTCFFIITGLSRTMNTSFSCMYTGVDSTASVMQTQLLAIVHYATTRDLPQLTLPEIRSLFDVLLSAAPCNFLVFGLGHDSLMWAALNPRGTTFFLEEDPKLVHKILARAPALRVYTVTYRTQLYEADHLLSSYKTEIECLPPHVYLQGNNKCRLALNELPDDVYNREWDVIFIDAPRGYYAEAPGRMATIFTAAVMGRTRKKRGVTHVFLHDVDRKVEKMYAEEFLCNKYLVKSVGKLWHFRIPPGAYVFQGKAGWKFC